jgi:hypothetical protein
MNQIIKSVVIIALAAVAYTASADTQTGKIAGFGPGTYNGKEAFVFKLEGSPSGGCNYTGRYALDTSSPHYKTTVASIMAAFHAQADVYVSYSQSCNIFPNAWDVSYVCTGAINC